MEEIYILFSLELNNCGRYDRVFDVELLSVHSTLEKAYNKVKNIGKDLELIDSEITGQTNGLDLGDGWVIRSPNCPKYPDEIKYFISRKKIE